MSAIVTRMCECGKVLLMSPEAMAQIGQELHTRDKCLNVAPRDNADTQNEYTGGGGK
jgi:hypothetical protein